MTSRIGVITFPGTLDDVDAARAARRVGAEAISLWHADADLKGVDAVIVPGGFSYGDYLRAGAIARFAPVNITVWSYVDQLGVAVLTDDQTFVDPHEATDALSEAFSELRRAAGVSGALSG